MKNSLKWSGASPICLPGSFIAKDMLEESEWNYYLGIA